LSAKQFQKINGIKGLTELSSQIFTEYLIRTLFPIRASSGELLAMVGLGFMPVEPYQQLCKKEN
jgi:hypothetical protein